MSRSQPYRNKMPVDVLKIMDVSSRITLFLVGQTGPLCFTFKDRLGNKYKTSIGADLKCSCSPQKNDHCIHTLYVMLKVFKVSPQNPIIWQAAYVDSQLSDLVAGKHTAQTTRRPVRPNFEQFDHNIISQLPSDFLTKKKRQSVHSFPEGKAQRMKLNEQSDCPICQQPMSEDESLSYCRVQCGNNFHLECLKVWAQHKSTTQAAITCPMCRSPFGPHFLEQIQYEEKQFKKKAANKIKIKFKCSGCGVDEIPKGVHKCLLCTSYELCEACYKANKHIKHPFIRQVEDYPDRWCGGSQRREEELKMKKFIQGKRKQKNVNQQLIQKLRKIEQDPTKLLDFIASSYPYVSKYISDNVDPYKKLDLNPEDMKCMKCCSKKMLFLRRLSCGHFIDHECLKENLRKEKFHCEDCGTKILKGYENLRAKEKQLENQKEDMFNVDHQFNPSHLERKDMYNFVLPEEATLADILGGRIRDSQPIQQEPEQSRLRQRLASNLVRGSQVLNMFRNAQHQQTPDYQSANPRTSTVSNRSQSTSNHLPQPQPLQSAQLRIRNTNNRHIGSEQVQHRNTSRNAPRNNRNSRQFDMLEAMIGRKVF